MIVEAAVQEDVDVIGLSILSGAHLELFPIIIEGLKKKGLHDAIIVAGGIIPEDDYAKLKALGVHGIFGPGATTQQVVDFMKKAVAARHKR
jgi:methylmalonyl-CoA mutase C-terminal domain/subunit